MEKYDVALSFAGEDRQYAKALADLLKTNNYSCFYDENPRFRRFLFSYIFPVPS